MTTLRKVSRQIATHVKIDVEHSARDRTTLRVDVHDATAAALDALMWPDEAVLLAGASALSNHRLTPGDAFAVYSAMLKAVL